MKSKAELFQVPDALWQLHLTGCAPLAGGFGGKAMRGSPPTHGGGCGQVNPRTVPQHNEHNTTCPPLLVGLLPQLLAALPLPMVF